jgi:hypothetical protein
MPKCEVCGSTTIREEAMDEVFFWFPRAAWEPG